MEFTDKPRMAACDRCADINAASRIRSIALGRNNTALISRGKSDATTRELRKNAHESSVKKRPDKNIAFHEHTYST